MEWSPLVSVQASSLPLVIISGSNQAVAAWASVMWCNMLSDSEPRVKPATQHRN